MTWSTANSILRFALVAEAGAPVLHLSGELDYGSSALFEGLLPRARELNGGSLELDLSRVTFCDLAGVRAVNRLRAELEATGVRLDLRSPHSAVRRVMELTGLGEMWEFGAMAQAEFAAQAHADTLNEMLDVALRTTGARMGSAQYFHAPTGTLHLVSHPGFDQDFGAFFETVQGASTSCAVAADEQSAVFVPDVGASPIFAASPELDALVRAGVGSCVSIPVLADGGLLGVVSTHRTEPGPWLTHQQKLFDGLAQYAADVLV